MTVAPVVAASGSIKVDSCTLLPYPLSFSTPHQKHQGHLFSSRLNLLVVMVGIHLCWSLLVESNARIVDLYFLWWLTTTKLGATLHPFGASVKISQPLMCHTPSIAGLTLPLAGLLLTTTHHGLRIFTAWVDMVRLLPLTRSLPDPRFAHPWSSMVVMDFFPIIFVAATLVLASHVDRLRLGLVCCTRQRVSIVAVPNTCNLVGRLAYGRWQSLGLPV